MSHIWTSCVVHLSGTGDAREMDDPRYQYVCSTSFTGITGEEIAFLLVAKRVGHRPKTVEDNLATAGVISL